MMCHLFHDWTIQFDEFDRSFSMSVLPKAKRAFVKLMATCASIRYDISQISIPNQMKESPAKLFQLIKAAVCISPSDLEFLQREVMNIQRAGGGGGISNIGVESLSNLSLNLCMTRIQKRMGIHSY